MFASGTICCEEPARARILTFGESNMNNIDVISPGNSPQIADAVRLLEDMRAPGRIDDLLNRDVCASVGQTRIGHRCHRRFQLNGIAFAMIRPVSTEPLKISGKSMGGIGCAVYNARLSKLGKIDNISMGGLMFHYISSQSQSSQSAVLDILFAERGFYLAGMPYKTISDVAIPGDVPGDPIEMRLVRLQFQQLNRDQFLKLRDFIFNHGAENGATDTKV